MKKNYLLTVALLFSLTRLIAQTDSSLTSLNIDNFSIEDLMNVKVTVATKTEQNVDEAPGTIRVITRQQISDMNALILRDVLNVYVPGMDVTPNSFKYDDRGDFVYNRGIFTDFAQQVLILFNGKSKFSETTFGSPFVAMEFTLDNVDRIEISTTPIPIHGGNAITTVNIITREKTMNGTEASLNTIFNEKDGYQGKRYSVTTGQNIGNWHLGVSAQYYDDRGQSFSDVAENSGYKYSPNTLRDGVKGAGNFTLNLRSGDGKFELGSWYKYVNKDAFLSGLVPSQSTNSYNYQGKVLTNYLLYKPIKGLDVTLGSSNFFFENYIDYGGVPYGYDNINYDYFLETNYTKQLNVAGIHTLLVGIKIETEGQSKTRTYLWDSLGTGFDTYVTPALQTAPNLGRQIVSAYAEDNWKISNKFNAVVGGRLDQYWNFRNTQFTAFNPRIALSYNPSKRLIIKALYASAFRPPAIYEIAGAGIIPPLYGNTNVKPEKVATSELNFIFKTNKMKIQLSTFYQSYRQAIEYVVQDSVTSVATNTKGSQILGGDLYISYYLNKNSYFFVNGSKFFTNSTSNPGGKVYYLPELYVNGGLNIRIRNFNFNSTAFYRGKRPLPDYMVINKTYVKDNFNFNLNLSYTLNKVKFYCMVQNLLDRKDNIPLSLDGFYHPLRRRVYNLGVSINF